MAAWGGLFSCSSSDSDRFFTSSVHQNLSALPSGGSVLGFGALRIPGRAPQPSQGVYTSPDPVEQRSLGLTPGHQINANVLHVIASPASANSTFTALDGRLTTQTPDNRNTKAATVRWCDGEPCEVLPAGWLPSLDCRRK